MNKLNRFGEPQINAGRETASSSFTRQKRPAASAHEIELMRKEIERLTAENAALKKVADEARSWMTMPKGVEGERNTFASIDRRQRQIIAALEAAIKGETEQQSGASK